MQPAFSNSIFWIDIDKVRPNPYQPRREFEEAPLRALSDSIRQYGVLQPLTVSRIEVIKDDGGIMTEYELIAGERRLRASKLAGLLQVPAIIRTGDDSMMKLELAIIENLQREDLNAVERARAFLRLTDEFKFTHQQVGTKVGKSREYVSNTLRLLQLPEEILTALSEGKITEGHTRPLMMLVDRPEEQIVLFKEIIYRKINVREAERIARKVAFERARKKETLPDPEIMEIEEKIGEALGTRVHIEKGENGGHIKIDFFSPEDLRTILQIVESSSTNRNPNALLERHELTPEAAAAAAIGYGEVTAGPSVSDIMPDEIGEKAVAPVDEIIRAEVEAALAPKPEKDPDAELYSVTNFSL